LAELRERTTESTIISWKTGERVRGCSTSRAAANHKARHQYFFHWIVNNSPSAKRSNGAGEEARRAESLRFHYYHGLKHFFSWLSTEGYLEHNPLDGIRFKAPEDPTIEPYQLEHKNKFLAVRDYGWKVAKTPRQKMLATRDKAILCLFVESGVRLQELAAMYYGLNPVLLLKQINENLEYLWKLAERPAHEQRKVKTYEALVT